MNFTNLFVLALTMICLLGLGIVSVEVAGHIRAGRGRRDDIAASASADGVNALLATSIAQLDESMKRCINKLDSIEGKIDRLIERGAL